MQKNDKPKCIKQNDCYLVCSNQKCQEDPFMCKEDDCQCNTNHQQCYTNVRWTLLKEKLQNKLKLQQDIQKEKIAEVDTILAEIQKQIHKKLENIDKNLIQFKQNSKNNQYEQMKGSKIFLLLNSLKNENDIQLNQKKLNNQRSVNKLLEQFKKISQLFERDALLPTQKKQKQQIKWSPYAYGLSSYKQIESGYKNYRNFYQRY